jgi:hypothetical protein
VTNQSEFLFRLNSDEVMWRVLGDELVVLEISTSTYLTLNGTAKVLWELLVDANSVSELVVHLVNRYQVTAGQATSDVTGFINTLLERGLLLKSS